MSLLRSLRPGRLVFPLACLAAAAIVLVSEGAYWQSIGKIDHVRSLSVTQDDLQELSRAILDAETGTRGFLLTGAAEYLGPYQASTGRIDASLQALEQSHGADAESAAALQKLRELTEAKLSELALTVRLVQEGKIKATEEIIKSGIGREKMDEIRAVSQQLMLRKERDIAESRNDIYWTLLLGRIGIMVLSVTGLIAFFMYTRQTRALKLQQLEQQRLVQAERDRLEAEVIQRTLQLTELAQHIELAREDERSRLARDLHDELGALLTSAKLDAARIKSRLGATAPDALERLNHLVETLNNGIALKRRIIEDLRPSALDNLGLEATLEILAREFSEGADIEVHCAVESVELDAAAELTVYRLVQEAITNLTKYAHARNVWITMAQHGNKVKVSVRDDGVGFDTHAAKGSAYGLVGMRFRVEAIGGSLDLKSARGKGTSIEATFPMRVPTTTQPDAADHVA